MEDEFLVLLKDGLGIGAGRIDPELRVVSVDQHAARAADRMRAITCTGTIGRAEIQWDASNDEIRLAIPARDAEECRRCSECWNAGHQRTITLRN